ncbi:MAG TPA: hypothetical protein VKX28_33850 [Xanthobacteraceae bacterium]|nr:hypothetical protein [Xanthobacteraceae bacterium]
MDLSRKLLSLTIHHLSRDQTVFERGIAKGKAPPLLLPLFRGGLGLLCSFQQCA